LVGLRPDGFALQSYLGVSGLKVDGFGGGEMGSLRVALAQINVTVGDIAGNTDKILSIIDRSRSLGVDILAVPELALVGYPPEDLLLKPQFVEANLQALSRIATATRGLTAIVGFVDRQDDLFNAAAILHDGRLAGVYHKTYLPNYGVFDEERYFRAGSRPLVLSLGDTLVGVNICEDIWYPAGPTELVALAGAQLVINISASPYHAGKVRDRERMIATRASDNVVMIAFCNLVGGQDELVFDGGSAFFDTEGNIVARGVQFEEDLVIADLNLESVFRQRLHDPRRRKDRLVGQDIHALIDRLTLEPVMQPPRPSFSPIVRPLLEPTAEIYRAVVLGTRDYVRKNGFGDVVIGLSGGVDSSLTAAIAVDALGPEHVIGVFMPSQFSSAESREDAESLAQNLGIRFMVIPIQATFEAYLAMMSDAFAGTERNVAEENIQARIRGNVLMALSNKFGWLVLTTGNKSEVATGYCTLYGDMAGGFAVIKDIPKMLVYDLCRYRNQISRVIPERVLEKAPTAELRPNQRDEDSLPPYRTLDPILAAYVEDDMSPVEIVALGFDETVVREVIRLVDRNEYKRRQAAPGVKITPRAFGKDRRLPITNRYREW